MSDSKVEELAGALYARCLADFPQDHLIYQQDLLNLGIIPGNNLALLMKCVQSLVAQSLLRMFHGKDERLAWKLVSQSDADILQNLTSDERLIYSVIHSTGRNGVWTRTLKSRTNLHQTIVTRCLKSLEAKNYIKSVRNVKFPQRKMYMLAHLQPSEDVTGGAWFTDGVLDADFIRGLSGWIERWVSSRSWFDVNKSGMTPAASKRKGPKITGDAQYMPFAPSFTGYPTVSEITAAINASGLTPVTMGESSIAQLLEMLCYDGRLISLRGGAAYRAVKKPNQIQLQKELGLQSTPQATVGIKKEEGVGAEEEEDLPLGSNGLTEMPCGRCPVLDLCEEGGPVNPENCEYYDEWMRKALQY
ncbi:DNA-directed RNA polymerase III subunit Rpc34 [Ascosphaera apis ARSEF 7405]|uniref:DNA-directed RNA polymerase III subunit RPC6 n=1 Tax=Ascosphaera apis ARSEF 7405 TaxID=392613 RepID=A0A162I621_9EURO|nr:DNA-directed RNA polymerase III subunit Rpc34 [Ascosphaera apis ARSEF 7405]